MAGSIPDGSVHLLSRRCISPVALLRSHESKGRCLQVLMAALKLCAAAEKGDCGKLRELLDGGGASVVDSSSNALLSMTMAIPCRTNSALLM